MNLNTPPNWRKGQTIFNFLEWLRIEKHYEPNQSSRMADCFYIEDGELDTLFDEFIKTQNQ